MRNVQRSLFYNYDAFLATSDFYRKYHALFSALDLTGLPNLNTGVGRTGYPRHAFLRACIVKHLEEIKSVPRLIEFLDAHPVLAEMCGFTMGSLPDPSQFYRFLKDTPNSHIQNILHRANQTLIDEAAISLTQFVIDSKPVLAATRENNPKNPNRNTRNKHKIPRRNPQATLGYYSYQRKTNASKDFLFVCGYRTHVIVSAEGISLVETTLPNDRTDAHVAKTLIKKLKRVYKFKRGAIFLGDSAYDVRDLYDLIVHQMKGRAFIPINPRNTQEPKILGPHGCPICDARLEMASAGAWREGQRDRLKFRCPLKVNPTLTQNYPHGCPVGHPRYSHGRAYGCTKYLDVTDDARARIPRDSVSFKNIYRRRVVVEQYFSRLGDREVEQTTHYKLRTVKNQMTIAHLAMSLVALAAVQMQRSEKIRCYRTFARAG